LIGGLWLLFHCIRMLQRVIEGLSVIANPIRLSRVGRKQGQTLEPQVARTAQLALTLSLACLLGELGELFGVYEGVALIASHCAEHKLAPASAAIADQIRGERGHRLLLNRLRA
jgi:hypothetical protein